MSANAQADSACLMSRSESRTASIFFVSFLENAADDARPGALRAAIASGEKGERRAAGAAGAGVGPAGGGAEVGVGWVNGAGLGRLKCGASYAGALGSGVGFGGSLMNEFELYPACGSGETAG